METKDTRAKGNAPKKFKNASGAPVKKRGQRFGSDIVFTGKNGTIQTMPSLQKKVAESTESLVGLQYVWEYRSPSKSVPPHYQCRLCKVAKLQSEILPHIKGWKHAFRYLKQHHAGKLTCEEEEAIKDLAVRKTVREVAKEVEKVEGQGKIRVMLKEPSEVAAFHGMNSAKAKPIMNPGGGGGVGGGAGSLPLGLGVGPRPGLFGYGEFPPGGGMSDFGMRDLRDLRDMQDMRDSRSGMMRDLPMSPQRGSDMGGMRRYSDGGPSPHRGSDGFSMGGGPMGGDGMGRPYMDDFHRGSDLRDFNDGMRRAGDLRDLDDGMRRGGMPGIEGNSIPATLLKYLDSFRIENENDAQIVLKITQKLTDALMEYRLRDYSPNKSSSLGPMNFNNSNSDRYSGNMGGPSRYFK